MPEEKPRVCCECGHDYPATDQHITCIMPTALGECGGKIKPEPKKEKP